MCFIVTPGSAHCVEEQVLLLHTTNVTWTTDNCTASAAIAAAAADAAAAIALDDAYGPSLTLPGTMRVGTPTAMKHN